MERHEYNRLMLNDVPWYARYEADKLLRDRFQTMTEKEVWDEIAGVLCVVNEPSGGDAGCASEHTLTPDGYPLNYGRP